LVPSSAIPHFESQHLRVSPTTPPLVMQPSSSLSGPHLVNGSGGKLYF
jgi:hypothetical protein